MERVEGIPVGRARVEGLERQDQAAEQSAQRFGVAVAELTRSLPADEHVGLQRHGAVVVAADPSIREGIGRESRHVRVAQRQPTEVRVGAEEADLDVDETVELLDRWAGPSSTLSIS